MKFMLRVFALSLLSVGAFAASVTFQVDMTIERALGNFNPDQDRVTVAGTFDNWTAETNFVNSGAGLYKLTLDIEPGDYTYRFLVVSATRGEQWEATDGRGLMVQREPITLNVVQFFMDRFLAVELNSFAAEPGDNSVVIRWGTATETNNSHFELFRDGQMIRNEPSQGNSSTEQHYSWTDTDVQNGTVYRYSLVSVAEDGARNEVALTSAMPTFDEAVVSRYELYQNYPNPFNPVTEIAYDLAAASHVTLIVYNAVGQKVATLADGEFTAGRHTVQFRAGNLSSGLYLYRLTAGNYDAVRKMVLAK